MEACVVERLTPRTVRGSSLAHRVVFLDKELYSTLSLFTQVYKWVLATYCWGVTLRWTSIPSRGEVAVLRRHTSCYGNRYKLRPFGPLAGVRLQPSPQGFSRPTHLLREKPWGRGWCALPYLLGFFLFFACLFSQCTLHARIYRPQLTKKETLRYT